MAVGHGACSGLDIAPDSNVEQIEIRRRRRNSAEFRGIFAKHQNSNFFCCRLSKFLAIFFILKVSGDQVIILQSYQTFLCAQVHMWTCVKPHNIQRWRPGKNSARFTLSMEFHGNFFHSVLDVTHMLRHAPETGNDGLRASNRKGENDVLSHFHLHDEKYARKKCTK